MLPKIHRLTDDYDFRRVRRLGTPQRTPFFVLTVAKGKKRDVLRFGFVVSTKIDKRATTRNGIKRLLRRVVAEKLPQLNLGYDVVITVTKGALGKTYEELSTTFNKVLSTTPLV